MSESETDIEFVSDMEWLHSHDREAALPPEKLIRLFALARRGADAADTVERASGQSKRSLYLEEIDRLRLALEAAADRMFDAGLNDAWADARAALGGEDE